MSLAEISGMTDQLRTEVHQRLDFVEDHLRFRVLKAKADPGDAEALVGTSRMSNAAIGHALKEATEVCDFPDITLNTAHLICTTGTRASLRVADCSGMSISAYQGRNSHKCN